MPATRLDIGKLAYKFLTHGLRLSSTCTILVNCDSNHNSTSLCSLNPTELGPDGLWVDQSNELRIVLTFLLDEIISDELERRRIVGSLATFLRTMEIWSQLHFRVSLTLPAYDGIYDEHRLETSSGLILSLMPIQKALPTRPSARIKVPFAIVDARPPQGLGLDSVSLKEVSISLAFSRVQPRGHLSRKNRRSEDPGSSDTEDMLFLDEDVIQFDEQTSSIDSRNITPPSSQSSVGQRPSESFQQQMNLGDEGDASILGVSVFARLVDVTLRRVIYERASIPGGIKSTCKAPSHKLDNISPALFSPGYREAVSSRSRMINSIARSITSVSQRSHGTLLPSVLSHLEANRAGQRQGDWNTDDLTEGSQESEPLNDLKVHLWKLIQLKLFNPRAACALKPTHLTLSNMPNPDVQPGEMLDTSTLDFAEIDESSVLHDSKSSLTSDDPLDEDSDNVLDDNESDGYFLDDYEDGEPDECLLDDIENKLPDLGGLRETKISREEDEVMLDEDLPIEDKHCIAEKFWRVNADEDLMLDC